jgi:nitronate monooxygenase
MGTRFIATTESMASPEYKAMTITSKVGPPPTFLPTIYTDKISGVGANFLRDSLVEAGIDPENPQGEGLGKEDFSKLDAGNESSKKHSSGRAWKDIWSAGHGVVNMTDIPSVSTLVDRLTVSLPCRVNIALKCSMRTSLTLCIQIEYRQAIERESRTVYPRL